MENLYISFKQTRLQQRKKEKSSFCFSLPSQNNVKDCELEHTWCYFVRWLPDLICALKKNNSRGPKSSSDHQTEVYIQHYIIWLLYKQVTKWDACKHV